MALDDWNWLLPRDNQDYPWDCAACSCAWAMRTVGFDITEQAVIAGLGPSRISPTYGLLDASGAGLVSYLEEMGINAQNNPACTWFDLWSAAGYQPMLIGGRAWNHWVGVRVPRLYETGDGAYELSLMNPAPGYKGINQTLDEEDFYRLGGFSAVWFASW